MKAMKKIIPMLLACLFAFSACMNPNTPNNSSSGNGGDSSSSSSSSIGGSTGDSSTGGNGGTEGWVENENVTINNGASNTTAQKPQTEDVAHYQTDVLHKVNVTESDRAFIVDGKSEYKLVVPTEMSTKLRTATTFFRRYLKEATDCYLPIESEESYTWSEDAKWIVFGRSDLFSAAGLTMPADELNASGYYIKSVGDSVFVAVKGEDGYHRAVLTLLKYIVGYEMYWSDTVVFEKDGTTLPDMDIIERPDYEYYVKGDQMTNDGEYGMGFDGDLFLAPNGAIYHNTFVYLPPETYQATHPDWYSVADGAEGATQLCYTARGNQEEFEAMTSTIANIVIDCLKENSELNTVTIEQQDRRTTCGCAACTANFEKYHSYAASIIMCINTIDDIVQEYLQQEADRTGQPKRMIHIIFFGYHKSEIPPAVKQADGTYKPVDEKVVCNPNVGVYIAPIDANYQHSFFEDENSAAAENIKGWAACSSIIYMWLYETNYAYYLYPINTWDTQIETYRFLKQFNAVFMYNEAQYNQGAVSHFSRLKEYINSKALFDVNVELNDVMDDFFTNYYGPAAGPMRAFFNQLQAHMRYLEETYPSSVTGNIYNRMEDAKLWPKKTLDGFLKLVDQAYELIEAEKDKNPEMYEVYKEHVLLESMFPRFAKLRLYKGTFTSEEFLAAAKQFRTDCEYFGIQRTSELTMIDAVWDSWGV